MMKSSMQQRYPGWLQVLALLLAGILLAGCSSAQTTQAPEPSSTSGATATVEQIEPTATMLPEPTPEPTAMPTEVVVSQCQLCHTDKDSLVALAEPEEEVESENEGKG